MLARYNDCVPNGAERIRALAEGQAKHRQTLEGSVVHGNLKAETRSQVFAFIRGLVAIVGGIWLIAQGKDAQGLGAIITAFTGLAGVFIYGRWRQSVSANASGASLKRQPSNRACLTKIQTDPLPPRPQ